MPMLVRSTTFSSLSAFPRSTSVTYSRVTLSDLLETSLRVLDLARPPAVLWPLSCSGVASSQLMAAL